MCNEKITPGEGRRERERIEEWMKYGGKVIWVPKDAIDTHTQTDRKEN